MTQSEKVLRYLRRNGKATGNELRSTFHIVDLPKVISILKKRGFYITSKDLSDGTCEYTYGEKKPTRRIEYVGGTAIIIEL